MGLKDTLETEVANKVNSLTEDINMSLGDSKGKALATTFLQQSYTCFTEFVNWMEFFYREVLHTSKVDEKEAQNLVLHCWLGFSMTFRLYE